MHDPLIAPIIVTAIFGGEDQGWMDDLRRAHFPPERNYLAAHLTLFHHLPPAMAREIDAALDGITRHAPAPEAQTAGPMNLGRGVAIRIRSPGLEAIRAALADRFSDVLIPQDRAGWRPHVTIQNKVAPDAARALFAELEPRLHPAAIEIAGLASWYYRGGPWEARRVHRFDRAVNRSGRPHRS